MQTGASELIERRLIDLYADAASEVRVMKEGGGKPAQLRGYAIRFNSLSKDLGGFQERIAPAAFDESLTSGGDVRALVDHDHTKLLGRTSAGTLKVGKDDRGIWFNVDLPDTQYARDVQALVERGDIRGMSFGFTVPVGGDAFTRENGTAIRTVNKASLKEVTVTSIPAYPDSSVHVRVDPGIVGRIAAADAAATPEATRAATPAAEAAPAITPAAVAATPAVSPAATPAAAPVQQQLNARRRRVVVNAAR